MNNLFSALWWLAFGLGLLLYTVVKFVIFKPTKLAKPEEQIVHGSPVRKPNTTSNPDNDGTESKKVL